MDTVIAVCGAVTAAMSAAVRISEIVARAGQTRRRGRVSAAADASAAGTGCRGTGHGSGGVIVSVVTGHGPDGVAVVAAGLLSSTEQSRDLGR